MGKKELKASKKQRLKSKSKKDRSGKTTLTKYKTLNVKVLERLKTLGVDTGKMSLIENPDEVKMSAVILKIAEPYIRMYWGTEIRVRAIISLAISVWNMTFLPQDEQIALQEKLIEEILPKDCNAADVATMHRIFDELQDRQRGLFPNLRKLIVGHDLRLDGKNIHLDISSLPLGEVAQKE